MQFFFAHASTCGLRTFALLTGGWLAVALLAGCSGGHSGDAAAHSGAGGTSSDAIVTTQPSTAEGLAPRAEAVAGGRELWRAIYMQGARIGYSHTVYTPLEEAGESLVRISDTSETVLERAGQAISQTVLIEVVETSDGELKRFTTEIQMGPTPAITSGVVRDGQLQMTTRSGADIAESTIRWPATVGGFFTVEQSLRRQPLQPGEQRTVEELAPLVNQISQVQLTAQREETVQLLSESRKLLRLDVQTEFAPGVSISWTMWTDSAGEVHKSEIPGIGQTMYLVSEQIALQPPPAATAKFDLITDTLVRVMPPIANPFASRLARYRVTMNNGSPLAFFAAGSGQSLEETGDRTAILTVSPRTLQGTQGTNATDTPSQAELQAALASTRWIQSDDPRIVEMARSVATNEDDPATIARELERFVHSQISRKDFSQAFATASDVARDLTGDCTEHAVLLAALARARGIPARVVTGLVYVEPVQAFGFHMWNEVFVDDRWVGLDATLGQGAISATHLKLSHTNLDSDAAFQAFLPVLNVMGQLNIDVLEIEP